MRFAQTLTDDFYSTNTEMGLHPGQFVPAKSALLTFYEEHWFVALKKFGRAGMIDFVDSTIMPLYQSTIRRFDDSTTVQFVYSTIRPLYQSKPFDYSMTRRFDGLTLLQLYHSDIRQFYHSTIRLFDDSTIPLFATIRQFYHCTIVLINY